MTKIADTNDGTCDADCSLREAIDGAVNGSTITFQAGLTGTIDTVNTLTITLPNLTIDATDATILVDGQGTHRVFNHTGNGTFTLINMTVQNGNAIGAGANGDGGGIRSNHNVTLINSTVSGSNAARRGGGIRSNRNVTLTNSVIVNNTAADRGGGIAKFNNGTVTLTNSLILDNHAGGNGGGIRSNRNITLTNSTVSGNSSGNNGGGIHSNRNVTVVNSVVVNNTTTNGGGGIAKFNNNGTVTLINSLIAGNRAGGNGGAVRAQRAIVATNSTIAGNQGGDGGGLHSRANVITLNNSLVLGNDAPVNPQVRAGSGGIALNSSAYGFSVGRSSGDVFVGLTIRDVFTSPVSPASAPTTAGNYRLRSGSPALDSGDNALVPGGVVIDLDGGDRILDGVVDMGAFEGVVVGSSIINPNQDIQIRNGNNTAAEVITSNGFEVLSYGPFNRNQDVVLEYLVRNPGAKTLELGELVLPSFLSVAGDPLPSNLGSFDSVLLELAVDTFVAGTLSGQVSLASNDPDANENPFMFNLVVRVENEPANALYVLPGIDLDNITITPNQQNVPVYSAYLLVPEGSVDVTINSLTINTKDIPALRDVSSLTLLIDGGTRGIQDPRDVVLSTVDDPTTDTITFEFEERTLQPDLPLWILVTADF